MTVIKSFVQSLVYLAVIIAILELLIPKGNMKKYIYVAISLLVLLNIVSPIFNVIKTGNMDNAFNNVLETLSDNVTTSESDVASFEKYKDGIVTKDLERNIYEDFKPKLNNMNIVLTDINITYNGAYLIEHIDVYISKLKVPNQEKAKKISEIISMMKSEYGIEEDKVTVIEEGI